MKPKTFLLLEAVLIGAIALVLFACSTTQVAQPSASTISLTPSAWTFMYSPGMSKPSASPNSKWQFDFPQHNGVHYLMTAYHPAKLPTLVSATFRVIGSGRLTFNPNGCPVPASVHLMLMNDMASEFGRWWSAQGAVLTSNGNLVTLTVPWTPDKWSSVFGKTGTQAPSDFNKFSPAFVGMTFGGGCYFGHGVWANGKVTFQLLDYKVQ